MPVQWVYYWEIKKMTNLLTEKDIKNFSKEKRTRILNVFFIVFSLAFWGCVIALSPKAFLIYSDYQDIKSKLSDLKNNPASVDYKKLEEVASSTKRHIEFAKNALEKRPDISKILPEVLVGKPKGISITSIAFSSGDKESNIYVSGTASSRDSLRDFSNNLKSKVVFSNVEVPVSNFAKSQKSDFSITLKLSQNYGK